MNFVFWLLVIVAVFVLWALISFLFIPLGQKLYDHWKKISTTMDSDSKEEAKEKLNKNCK